MHAKAALKLQVLLNLALLAPAFAHAAEEPNLDYLIFDQVPLQVVSLPDGKNKDAGITYQAKDLAALPQANKLPVRAAVDKATAIIVATEYNATNDPGNDSGNDEVSAMEARLKQQELTGDAFNQQLTETLMALARAYEKQGDFTKALAVYDRANHLIRVNYGLFDLGQEPMIKRMINDHIARGDVASADEAQNYLFYLRSKNYGSNSVELVPALQELAQWKITASRMEAVLTPPAEGTPVRAKKAGSRGSTYDLLVSRLGHLKEATALHESAVRLLQKNTPGAYARLSVSEQQFAVSNFLYTRFITSVNPVMNDMGGEASFFTGIEEFHSNYSEGRRALERRVKLLTEASGPSPLEVAQARVDLVDWIITTGGRGDYKELFENAYRDLVASGAKTSDIDRLFKPALPVQLPTFVYFPYTRTSLGIGPETALEYHGYVDMQFDVALNGESGSPRVLYQTPDTPERVIDLLTRSLRRAQFRPHIVDGKMVPQEGITVRYYYTY